MPNAVDVLTAALAEGVTISASEWIPCTGDVQCSSHDKLKIMPGLISPTCLPAALPTPFTSICSFGCSQGYLPLTYTTSSITVARSCFNTAVPATCSATTSSQTVCSTSTAGAAPFSTAVYAKQGCPSKSAIGTSGCSAVCPTAFVLATSGTDAYCTSTSQQAADAKQALNIQPSVPAPTSAPVAAAGALKDTVVRVVLPNQAASRRPALRLFLLLLVLFSRMGA